MKNDTRRWFGLVALCAAAVHFGPGAAGQATVSGTIMLEQSIESHLNAGGERLDLLGVGTDPDDGVTFLVCRTDTDVACPSSDNIHVYRHDVAGNRWVFDSSFRHPNQVFAGIVDVDGDTIAIGRVFDPVLGNDGVDVYRRNTDGWVNEASFRPADHFPFDRFGHDVSIDGDVLAVTALHEGDDSVPTDIGPGSVYLFERTSGVWAEIDKVTASDAGHRDRFGDSIAVAQTAQGWRLIVGSPDHSTDPENTNRAGAVYVFERRGGSVSEVAALSLSSSSDVSGDFGSDGIGFDGEVFAVSDDEAVYIYRFDSQQNVSSVGTYVSIPLLARPVVKDAMVLVGEPAGSIQDSQTPSVTLIRETATGVWTSTRYPAPSGMIVGDNYASTIDFNGTLIAAGVPSLDDTGQNTGGVWTQTAGSTAFPEQLVLEGLGSPGSNLGASVSIAGSWMAIGMPGADDACREGGVGSVRLLQASDQGWSRWRDLVPPADSPGTGFGTAVAFDTDTLAVGMPGYIDSGGGGAVGAVFVYRHGVGGWTLEQKLEGALAGDGFAHSVVVEGDDLVVGRPGSMNTGSVVHYCRDAGTGLWTQIAETSAAGVESGGRFGHALSLCGGSLLVGAPRDKDDEGSVHAYSIANGSLSFVETITVSDAVPGALAGWAIAQNAEHAFIGLPFAEPGQPGAAAAGRVAVMTRSTGSIGSGTTITDPVGQGTGFGAVLSATGTLVAVGALQPAAGAVQLFGFDGIDYQFIGNAALPAGTSAASYGAAVGLGEETLVVGAPRQDSSAVPAGGKAHLFAFEVEYTVPPCDEQMAEDRVQWIEDDVTDASEWFGYSAEVDDGFAIVGVPFDKFSFEHDGNTVSAPAAGKAAIYERTGLRSWTPIAAFRGNLLDVNAVPGNNNDWLGWSVDIENGTAAAGGPQAIEELTGLPSRRSGAVQVYERQSGEWQRTVELFPSNNTTPGADLILEFGNAVDFNESGSRLIIGARNSRLGGIIGTGAAFVYERSGGEWVESNVLTPPSPQFADHNGDSVAIEEDWAVVGSPDDDNDLGGALHFFRRTGFADWQFHETVLSPNNEPNSQFGESMELSRSDLGLTLLVGARGEDDPPFSGVGAAYVFVLDESTTQWNLVQRLEPGLLRGSEIYGYDVSIDRNTIAVGGPQLQNVTVGSNRTGGVELYNLDTSMGRFKRRVVIRPDANQWSAINQWGRSIGLSGGTVLLGTELADGENFAFNDVNRNWGALIAYDIICTPDQVCLADVNGDGMLTPSDFNAWIAAFNAMSAACDQNGDGACTPNDFNAWILNYNNGC